MRQRSISEAALILCFFLAAGVVAGDNSGRTFTGPYLSEIAYPIGGLGTGNILLARSSTWSSPTGPTELAEATLNGTPLQVKLEPEGDRLVLRFSPTLEMKEGDRLTLAFRRSSS